MTGSENRSEYTVTLNGLPHTVMLTAEEAEKVGATKAGGEAGGEAEAKAHVPANKSRTARAKDG
jgi:hypothetical protein